MHNGIINNISKFKLDIKARVSMKKSLWFSLLMLSPITMASQNLQEQKVGGYSYFSFGMESIDYEERITSSVQVTANQSVPFSFKSSGSVSSPTIRSGGLFVINDAFDFAIDTSATFAPQSDNETWYMDFDYGPFQYDGEKVQENQFSYTDATSRFLVQYKFNQNLRFVLGGEFMYHQYKRTEFNFTSPLTETQDYVDKCVNLEGSNDCILLEQVEEEITNLNVVTGLAYESGSLKHSSMMHSAKLIAGSAVWSDVVNSDNTDVAFKETGGYTIIAEWRTTFSVSPGMNLGFFANYKLTERNEEMSDEISFVQDGLNRTKVVTIPEATTTSITLGISAAWDL